MVVFGVRWNSRADLGRCRVIGCRAAIAVKRCGSGDRTVDIFRGRTYGFCEAAGGTGDGGLD